MYYYIVDPQPLSQRQFERVQNQLYSSISEYHINGEIVRVTGIRTVKQLVETAFFHQANTIVAVGGDQTLNEVVSVIADRPMTVGFIPLKTTELSELFGIPNIAVACKNLAVRRVADLDLGVVNDRSFIGRLSFGLGKLGNSNDFLKLRLMSQLWNKQPFEVKFAADDQFQGSSQVLGGIIEKMSNPTDGLLQVSLIPKLTRWEIIRFQNAIAKGEYSQIPNASILRVKKLNIAQPIALPVTLNGVEITKTPVTVTVKPRAFKLIVGRERKFQ